MKNIKFKYFKIILLLGFIFTAIVSCERELSDEVEFAKFPSTAEIFTDTPIGMGSDFYFPFLGSKATAWSVDEEVSYKGSASMRFDVPNANDPDGNYAGAIFRVDGAGRDLTDFDALTFWAKASQGVNIGVLGFGTDFLGDKYTVVVPDVSFSTNWVKYIIPIPDPSKLFEERGMFTYSAGTQGTNGLGYTFWIDELKFEKLGAISQPRPFIWFGEDASQEAFTGSTIDLSGTLGQLFDINGKNLIVYSTPAYFTFTSSNINVAIVNEKGLVSIVGEGTANITATLAGVAAEGSLKVTSSGALPSAPLPTRPDANVKSIFSDAYIPATEINFNPNFGGSTTQTTKVESNGDSVLKYTNNNYTGIIFDNIVDASELTYLHIDIFTQQAGTTVGIQIRDIGANGVIETDVNTGNPIGDDKDYRFTATGLTVGGWKSFEIPLGGNLASQKNNLGALILVDGPDFIIDNLYFYKE